MKNLQFNIEYHAAEGEQLVVCIRNTKNGNEETHHMQPVVGGCWTCLVTGDYDTGTVLDYYYAVEHNGKHVRHEWQTVAHRLKIMGSKTSRYAIYNHWIDLPEDSYRYSSAFTDCVARHDVVNVKAKNFARTVRLKVRAPQLRTDERLVLAGADKALGEWRIADALPMTEQNYNEWTLDIDAAAFESGRIEFKFVVLNSRKEKNPMWEGGTNRFVDIPKMEDGDAVVYELPTAFFAIYDQKLAGTLVPVFSLRSKGSFGVGDFGDLKMMVEWVAKTNQRVLQILPINDTTNTHTWLDSYPYSSISIFALHPQYADLRQLPPLQDKEKVAAFENLRQELNALPKIDYERVNDAKTDYLKLIFLQEGAKAMRTAAYKRFFEEERHWLEPYAAYCVKREKGRGVSDSPLVDEKFYYYVQYILSTQMREVHEYACQHGVVLKGDIPIGVNRTGSDVAAEPRYFNMNGQAGAPPDDFSEDGQNWGFPTYNWDEMLADDGAWWVRRFQNMAKYFDAYRIDHVLGFFRIWEIPVPEKSGLYGQFQPALPYSVEEIESLGLPFRQELYLEDHKRQGYWHPRINALKMDAYQSLPDEEKHRFYNLYNDFFYRRNNQFWYEEAMKKLPKLVNATRMLVCAEDLGMVPDCVPWVMNQLRILSLELQSMPKDPCCRFGHLSRNPYRSVCTISSHDMPTLRMWWDEDLERTQAYYSEMLHRGGAAPHPLPGWLAADIITRHLMSPSMLCILALQDWLAIDENLRLTDANAERVNIPANPHHYWRYRMHLNIEDLIDNNNFNNKITELVSLSGRR